MIKYSIFRNLSFHHTHTNDKLTQFSNQLKAHEYKRIIVLLGSGASAGVPNIKSPEIIEEIRKLDLPFPNILFDINYFKFDPEPFYKIFHKLIPQKITPNPSHYFVKCLEEKSMLLMSFTKNIDLLERKAGISENKIVFAHGTYDKFYCTSCGKVHSTEKCLGFVWEQKVPYCECGGPIKPDVLFIGEKLNHRFYHGSEIVSFADLMIIIGCSLDVYPFSSLPTMVLLK